jgi:hypothetical protein
MRIAKIFVAFAATVLVLTACANRKEPAEKAVAQIEAALAEIRDDAAKYAPDELNSLDNSVATLKKGLASKDYNDVVMGAPSVASAVTSLRDTVAKAKIDAESVMAAAQAEWGELSTSVPQLVETIQSRVDTLSKSRRLPKNVDKATFETIKTDFETVKSEWTAAASDFASGAAGEAVRKARAVRAKAEEIHAKLGMNT